MPFLFLQIIDSLAQSGPVILQRQLCHHEAVFCVGTWEFAKILRSYFLQDKVQKVAPFDYLAKNETRRAIILYVVFDVYFK